MSIRLRLILPACVGSLLRLFGTAFVIRSLDEGRQAPNPEELSGPAGLMGFFTQGDARPCEYPKNASGVHR